MICKNCGGEVKKNGTCEYCGVIWSDVPESAKENTSKNIGKFVLRIIKKVWGRLTRATKVVLIFWMICCFSQIGEIVNTGILGYLSTSAFGFLLFGGIAQIISIKKKRTSTPTVTGTVEEVKSVNEKYDAMDGHEFEYFCGKILSKNGFSQVEVTKGSGDQGIDILALKDGVRYGIQCKCYSSNIGNKAVQEAFAGRTFYNCHVAAVLTNRYFTKSAQELAEKNGVLLWDRDMLDSYIDNGK